MDIYTRLTSLTPIPASSQRLQELVTKLHMYIALSIHVDTPILMNVIQLLGLLSLYTPLSPWS